MCLFYYHQTSLPLDLVSCYSSSHSFDYIMISCQLFTYYYVTASSIYYVFFIFSYYYYFFFFFLNNPPPPNISPLPLHAALPIYPADRRGASVSIGCVWRSLLPRPDSPVGTQKSGAGWACPRGPWLHKGR